MACDCVSRGPEELLNSPFEGTWWGKQFWWIALMRVLGL